MDQLNWLTAARKFFHEGNLEESLTVIDNYLQSCPASISALELKVVVLQILKRYGEAQTTNQNLLQWIRLNIASDESTWLESAEDFFQAGVSRLLKENWHEASIFFKQVTELDPEHYQAWTNLGTALLSLERFDEARLSYDRATELEPDLPDAWYMRGIYLSNIGYMAEAIESYDSAIKSDPKYKSAWKNKGSLQLELKNPQKAVDSFARVLEIDDQDSRDWADYGWALYSSHEVLRAIESFQKATQIDSQNDAAWNVLGDALSLLERYEEAIIAFEQAVSLKPNNCYYWLNHGVGLSNLKDFNSACNSFKKAIRINSDFVAAHINLGNNFSKLGLFEDAILSLEKALKIDPENYHAWEIRALVICEFDSRPELYEEPKQSFLQKMSILKQPEPHLAALQESLPHLTVKTSSWAQIHLHLGNNYIKHSKLKQNPLPFWRDALHSYEKAYEILQPESFPNEHLQILQGLIRAHLLLGDIVSARTFQREGLHLFQKLRDEQPLPLKPSFEKQFSGFSHLEIDLLIGENQPILALEQAEFYKNRCLTWILEDWKDKILSPSYQGYAFSSQQPNSNTFLASQSR